MRPSRSISTRLALAGAAILTFGGLMVIGGALAYGRHAADEVYDKLLSTAAVEIARAIEVEDNAPIVDLPVSAFEILSLAPDDRVFYRVLSDDGETLTGYSDLPPPEVKSVDFPVFYDTTYLSEPIRLAAVRRVIVDRAFVADLKIVVGQTLRARTALSEDIAVNALIILVLVGAMLIALSALAVQLSLAPLREIENALFRRDPADLSPFDVEAPREVETMIAAINRFMLRLSGRVSSMQTMISTASHQLRTPVAALRAQAELAEEETDPGRLQQIIARIRTRAVGLSRLTDQLLNQALVIHRADAAPRTRLDLREIAVAVAEEADHNLLADGSNLHLKLNETPVTVRGDELSLTEAVKNLVNNAFRYGRPPVVLSVTSQDRDAVIMVADHGEGMDDSTGTEDTRRFTSEASDGGAGLGLSIVRAVADAHHGRVEVRRNDAGLFFVAIILPAIEVDGR